MIGSIQSLQSGVPARKGDASNEQLCEENIVRYTPAGDLYPAVVSVKNNRRKFYV
jgi:hypothetical protein